MGLVPIELSVGDATEAEREWAARLMASSEPWLTLGRGLDQCRAACHLPGYEMLVARDGAEPQAFALLHPAASPARRTSRRSPCPPMRAGAVWAPSSSSACERHFRPSARHFFLCVSSFNARARAFYERQGYRRVGEFPDYLIDGASEILMHKRLDRVVRETGTRGWWLVALLSATATASYLCRVNLSVVGVLVMREFGLTQVQMGPVFSAFLFDLRARAGAGREACGPVGRAPRADRGRLLVGGRNGRSNPRRASPGCGQPASGRSRS